MDLRIFTVTEHRKEKHPQSFLFIANDKIGGVINGTTLIWIILAAAIIML